MGNIAEILNIKPYDTASKQANKQANKQASKQASKQAIMAII